MYWERSMASQRSFARPSCSRRNKVSQRGWTADNMCLKFILQPIDYSWYASWKSNIPSGQCRMKLPQQVDGALPLLRPGPSAQGGAAGPDPAHGHWQGHLSRPTTATSVSLRLPGSSYSSSVSSSSANHCVKPVQQRGPLQPVVCLTLWATQSVRRSGHILAMVSYKRVFFQLSGFLTSGWTNSCPQESTPHGEDECRPVRQIAPATNNEWRFIRLQQTINDNYADCNKQPMIIYQLAKNNEWQFIRLQQTINEGNKYWNAMWMT